MNKREREAVAELIAEWEWIRGGSASEATARNECARDITSTLRLPKEEIDFARLYAIFRRMGDVGDDDLFDALSDLVESEGYDAVVDIIEASNFDGLRSRLTAALAQKEEG